MNFHQQSNSILTGSTSGGLWVWPLENARSGGQRLKGHAAALRHVRVEKAAGGHVSRLVTAGDDHWIGVWDLRQRRALVRKLLGHSDKITSVAVDAARSTIVSGSRDTTLRLWTAATGQLQQIVDTDSDVYSCCFSPDGKSILSGHEGGSVQLWDARGRFTPIRI